MIYRNERPYPITLTNSITGETLVIRPQGLTPDLSDNIGKLYEGILIPLYTSPVPKNVQERIMSNELFEDTKLNDGFYEVSSETTEDGLQVLNEVKRGRGRPKKV